VGRDARGENVGPQLKSEPEGSESKLKGGEVLRSKADRLQVVGSRFGASCEGRWVDP
jgi:hypothetical protein